MTTETTARQTVARLKKAYKPIKPRFIYTPCAPRYMELLQPYVGPGGWTLIRYRRPDDQQAAFNLVAGPLFGPKSHEWECIILLPFQSRSDPLAQDGYIGIKQKVELP